MKKFNLLLVSCLLSFGIARAQTGEQYLQQQLPLAKAGNYWAKYNLWDAYHRGKHGVAKDPAEASRWLQELVQGAYLAKFEPADGFHPRTPKEILDSFGAISWLGSCFAFSIRSPWMQLLHLILT